MQGVNKNPSRSDVRTFGLVMLLGFGVIGAVLWYQSIKPPDGWWPDAGWGWNSGVPQVIAIALLALRVVFVPGLTEAVDLTRRWLSRSEEFSA